MTSYQRKSCKDISQTYLNFGQRLSAFIVAREANVNPDFDFDLCLLKVVDLDMEMWM